MKTKDCKTVVALSSEGATHHPYGPSRWPALLECPCWEAKPPTEQTERGTALHVLFASVMSGEYRGEPVDAIERNVVNAAKEILRTVEPTLGRFYIEEHVELPGPAGTPSGLFGRLDLAWIDVDTLDLHVCDLKSAENPDRNYRPQLLAYAAGMARHLHLEGPRNVVLHMIYADSGRITSRTADIGDAMTEYLSYYLRIADIRRGNIRQPQQCGWCDLCVRFADCPTMKAVVDKAAPRLADAAKPEVWANYSPERKAQLVALSEMLAKWCATVREQATADAKAGVAIEDPPNGIFFGLQERKGRLLIEDARQAWEVVKPHLTAASYRACLSVNQAGLKAALKQAGVKLSDINALVERCGTRLPSTTVFVRRGLKESA